LGKVASAILKISEKRQYKSWNGRPSAQHSLAAVHDPRRLLVLGRHCPAFFGAFAALFCTRLTGLVVLVFLAFCRTLLAGFRTGRSDDRLKGAASCADLRTGSTNVSAVEAEFDTRLAIRLSLSEFAEAFVSTLQAHGLAFEAFLDARV
jgi:hypothetical protein